MSPSFDPEAGTGTLVATSNPLPRHPIPPMPTIDPVNEEAFHQEVDNRRSSIIISGANGNSVPFAITGRNRGSRPGSIRNEGASRPGSVRNGTSGGLSVAPIFPVTFDNGSPTSPIPPTGVNGNQRVPSNSNLSTHVFTNNDDDDEDGDDYVPGAGLGIRVGGGAVEEGNTLVPELLQRMRDQLGIDDTMEAGTPPDHQTIYTGGGESSRGRSAALAEENKREATPGRSGGERDVF
ncbi:hypothetical protein BT69DRAFT_344986 [Atractiella rhizophila]|nr:hypothetical protein BT69DRAFT_344986 [Atractiella rhizophila]